MEKIVINEFKSDNKSTKIVAFDFDYTICMPLGSEFARNENDSILYRKTIPGTLKGYWESGYLVVVFTNQSKNAEMHILRIKKFITKYELKIHYVYCATRDDDYRKPKIGMYQDLVKTFPITVEGSFYCGDAAGRKNDFSDSDKVFAKNCGLEFKLPEEVFPLQNDEIKLPENKQNMIIMIGAPASGKSTLCTKLFSNLDYISSDILKTKAKTISATETSLKNKHSVVIDNTNPSHESRAPFIELAKKYGAEITYVFMNTPISECKRLNRARDKPISTVVYNVYAGKLQFPDSGRVIVYDR